MKRVFLLLFTLILIFFSAFSYASFPVISDTVQVQKETLEEYQLRIQKQGVFTKKNSEIIFLNLKTLIYKYRGFE